MKCKICGECFAYHVSNAHLEKHDISRSEYNKIPIREFNLVIKDRNNRKKDTDIIYHVKDTIYKAQKRRRR